jgi:hypothetical protein
MTMSDPARAHRLASTALFLGVIALISSLVLIGGLIAIPAILLARRAARQLDPHNVRARAMARTGAILGSLAILAAIIALIIYVSAAQLARHKHSTHHNPPTTQFHP